MLSSRPVTKEKPGFWTHRRAFEQVRRGSNIHLLPYSLVSALIVRLDSAAAERVLSLSMCAHHASQRHPPAFMRWTLMGGRPPTPPTTPCYRDHYQRTRQRLGRQHGARVARVEVARKFTEASRHWSRALAPRRRHCASPATRPSRATEWSRAAGASRTRREQAERNAAA